MGAVARGRPIPSSRFSRAILFGIIGRIVVVVSTNYS